MVMEVMQGILVVSNEQQEFSWLRSRFSVIGLTSGLRDSFDSYVEAGKYADGRPIHGYRWLDEPVSEDAAHRIANEMIGKY